MYNYDEIDYNEEKTQFIQSAQQKVWDLWVERYQRGGWFLNDELKQRIAQMVEDWTGHELQIDVGLAPQPQEDIPSVPTSDAVRR